MRDIENLPYRPCVGVMLLNKENMVFVGRRIDDRSEAWQMPQGGIDEGENPQQAVIRELKEEIGTDKAEILAASSRSYCYDLPKNLVPVLWNGKYKGQEQTWFAMRFLGVDSDINIATSHPEFCEWRWVSIKELPDIIVPFKRDVYSAIVKEFSYLVE